MVTLKRFALMVILALANVGAHACRAPASLHEVKFLPTSTALSATEVKRFAEWRIKTRKYFPSGFEAVIVAWGGYGITREMAMTRIEHVRKLLKNSGAPDSDLTEHLEIRHTAMASPEDEPLNTVEIAVAPRCPHYCCFLEPNVAR
ncbi:hypothetical protein [Cupriavidus campinensis]